MVAGPAGTATGGGTRPGVPLSSAGPLVPPGSLQRIDAALLRALDSSTVVDPAVGTNTNTTASIATPSARSISASSGSGVRPAARGPGVVSRILSEAGFSEGDLEGDLAWWMLPGNGDGDGGGTTPGRSPSLSPSEFVAALLPGPGAGLQLQQPPELPRPLTLAPGGGRSLRVPAPALAPAPMAAPAIPVAPSAVPAPGGVIAHRSAPVDPFSAVESY